MWGSVVHAFASLDIVEVLVRLVRGAVRFKGPFVFCRGGSSGLPFGRLVQVLD